MWGIISAIGLVLETIGIFGGILNRSLIYLAGIGLLCLIFGLVFSKEEKNQNFY